MHQKSLKLEKTIRYIPLIRFYLKFKEEKQDPLFVIREFFDEVKLVELRMHLYNLLEVSLTQSNTVYDEASERDA